MVKDCVINLRNETDILFHMKENGEVLASLHRYAIIPVEEYEMLKNYYEIGTKKI